MGGRNPIKKILEGAVDITAAPYRMATEAIGAKGATAAIDQVRGGTTKLGEGVIDVTSGKAQEQKKAAQAAQAKAASDAQAAESERNRQAMAAESARIEGERMRAGSGARTLLTGPQGLDEEESITRRTLAGM